MKLRLQRGAGLTRIETVVIIATLVVLVFLLIPRNSGPKDRAQRINCVSNLKQIGNAVRVFGFDHGGDFAWRVPFEKGGAMDRVSTGDPTHQFLVMTNELVSPKVLACVSDRKTTRVADFAALSRSNTSYFLCLEGDESITNSLLSGDRNITGGSLTNRLYVLPTRSGKAGWGKDIHQLAGNIGLSDGSVLQVTTSGVNKQMQMMSNEVVRLLVP